MASNDHTHCDVIPDEKSSGHPLSDFLLAAVLLVGGLRTVVAQDTTTTILGTITDSSGATLAGAEVTVTSLQTNVAVRLQTNDSGAYTAPNLNPDTYSITIKLPGFRPANVPNLAVSAGDQRRTDVSLVIGGTTERVQITTVAPVLQTDASSIGSNVTERAVQDLPLTGRNFINLAQIIPGASEGAPNSISNFVPLQDKDNTYQLNGKCDLQPWQPQHSPGCSAYPPHRAQHTGQPG